MDERQRELLTSWLTKAANDLRSARILGGAPDGPLDSAVFHCQQAAEKAVKAFLLYKGITPENTHDIRKLALRASLIEARFNEFIAMAAALTPYAWEYRYPGDLAETYPAREEFDEAIKQAQGIYDFVLGLLPSEAHPGS
jgi:HEPN domain-containing protein